MATRSQLLEISSVSIVDNTVAIQWAHNPVASMKAKHLAIWYKCPPELVRDKIVRCVHILSLHNASDVSNNNKRINKTLKLQ